MDYKTGIATAGVVGVSALVLGQKYFKGATCKLEKDLTGQVIIITGSNTGIGKETARALAHRGATVIVACRNEEKAQAVINEFKQEDPKTKAEFIKLDLADLKGIKEFVAEFKRRYQKLDMLINNAGAVSRERKETKDGYELQFGTNFIGPFYLTNLLLDTLKSSGHSRIITVSSDGHRIGKINWDDLMSEKSYAVFKAYCQTKLAVLMFTKELQKKLEGTNVKAVAVHPGAVKTEINREVEDKWYLKALWVIIAANPIAGIFWKNPTQGAQTSIFCALQDHEKLEKGAYYAECKETKPSSKALKEEDQKRLWEVTEKLIADKQKN